jgi:hypothetical protein
LHDLYDKDDFYSVFSTLPSFTYVIMGNIIMLFIVELILQYNSAKRHKKEIERRKRIVSGVRIFVIIEIITVLTLFFGSIALRKL